jgi:pyrophosphatase PpaX
MKSYRYILLDWDGNLAKTVHIWFEETKEVLNKHGHNPSDALIIKSMADLRKFASSLGIKDAEGIAEEIRQAVFIRLPSVELYPDALFVLESLRNKGKELALVTSGSKHIVTETMNKYNLTKMFDAIITKEDVSNHKPHPEPLDLGMKLLGATKDKTIMIGDTDNDIGAANNVGIDSILFFPPEHKKFYDIEKLKEHKPTYIVSDFRHIIEIIG